MGWVVTPHPGRFTPMKDPVPILQEAGWAPGPVWTGAENFAPDRPVRSESLHRLSYRGPYLVCRNKFKKQKLFFRLRFHPWV